MNSRLISGAGLVVALVALVAVNVFSNAYFTGARADLTENGAYTLTEGHSTRLRNWMSPSRCVCFCPRKSRARRRV